MIRILILSLFFFGISKICFAETSFLSETVVVGSVTAKTIHTTALSDPNLSSLFMSIIGSNIRYLVDGTVVTSTNGHRSIEGKDIGIDGINNCHNLSFISEGTSTITLSYFRK